MRRVLIALSALVVAAVTVAPAPASPPAFGETRLFARIGQPGMPEGIVVDGDVVYVGTHVSLRGNRGEGPSKIFKLDRTTGAPLGEITIQGQNLAATHGILHMGFDAQGRLYVLDRNPARMIQIDLATGVQTDYAVFPDLEPCPLGPTAPPPGRCSPTMLDQAAFPDFFAFDANGYAYVTDFESATIWRVPPGGGHVGIWFQDARLDGIFGPNGIVVDPTGTKLYFAQTASTVPATYARGIIYTLPLVDAPTAADLQEYFVYPDHSTGPDGIAFGASGRLYVALAGTSQISVLEGGAEVARFPDAVSNAQQEVAYDMPASLAFDGNGSLLVTNQSYFTANERTWAVLAAYVNDTALPLIRPSIP